MIPVGDVKLAGDSTDDYTSDVAYARNCINSFDKMMPRIDVIDRDRSSIFGGLIDRI